MKRFFAYVFAAALIAVCAFAGCNKERERFNWFRYMNCDAYVFLTNGESRSREREYRDMCEKIDNLLRDIENSLSAEKESCISRFNSAAAGERVEIDKTAYEVLSLAKSAHAFTDGYYNPAVYYSVRAYGFTTGEYPENESELPEEEEVQAYRALYSSFSDIVLSCENGAYYAVKPQKTVSLDGEELTLKIDLGGIGKGYCADRVSEIMDEYNFGFGYFSFGDSSIVFKSYAEGEPFELAVRNPRDNGAYKILNCPVKNEAVSSSADSEQFYTLGGKRYCHIINPATGKPVETGIMSATVIGGTAAENDALSTAIMAMGREKAVGFINAKLRDRRVIFSFEDDGYYFYANFEDYSLPENGVYTAYVA